MEPLASHDPLGVQMPIGQGPTPSCPGLWQISKRWCSGDAGACDRVALLRFRCLTDLENCKLRWKPARENCQQSRPLSGHRFWSLLVQLTHFLGGCSETFASTYVSSSSTAVFGRGRWRVSGVQKKRWRWFSEISIIWNWYSLCFIGCGYFPSIALHDLLFFFGVVLVPFRRSWADRHLLRRGPLPEQPRWA